MKLCVFNCSNLAYSLLGNCLIEKIYGSMQFEDYIQKFILQPLGMTNTGFEYTQEYVCYNFIYRSHDVRNYFLLKYIHIINMHFYPGVWADQRSHQGVYGS